jgi:hypothetical protein
VVAEDGAREVEGRRRLRGTRRGENEGLVSGFMLGLLGLNGGGHPLAKTMRPKIASLGKIAKEEVTYIKVLSPF